MGPSEPGAPRVADRRLPWLDEDDPNTTEDRSTTTTEDRSTTTTEDRPTMAGPTAAESATPAEPQAPVTAPQPPGTGPPPASHPVPAGAPRRRSRAWLAVVIIGVVVVLAVATVLLAVLDAGDRPDSGRDSADTGAGTRAGTGDHTITAPLGDRREALFDLVSGTTTVNIRSADLGDLLYRVATPDGSRSVPAVLDQGNQLQLHLTDVDRPDLANGPAAVDIQLSTHVRWNLRITGGAAEHLVDMGTGQLAGIEFAGGATRIELTLPRPEGTVPVRMSGGAGQFAVHAPASVPVRARLGNGAAEVTVDGRSRAGIAAGTLLTPDGWDRSTDRYDVDAAAGVAQLTVDRG